MNRRQFLIGAAAVGATACGVVPAEGDAGFFFNPRTQGNPETQGSAGNQDQDAGDQQQDQDAGDQQQDAGPQPDAGTHGVDAGVDAGTTGPTCPGSNVVAAAAPATFQTNKPVYYSSANAFIVRDANGLWAVSSICTHQGCTITAETSYFYCGCHRSEFTFNGAVMQGPASRALPCYALCLEENGNVGIETRTTVSASTRLDV